MRARRLFNTGAGDPQREENTVEKLGWHSLGTSFDCECGEHHELPIEACYVGERAAAKLAEFAHGRCGGKALVVSDENTRRVAGERLLGALSQAGIDVTEKVYPGDEIEATQERADEVAAAGAACDFYVAVGAGTLSDLAKAAGSAQKKPVLLYPTAASMNGYTSAIVALKVRGLKRTLPCQPATGIFADPEVVATAPQRMVAAGVADFMSKCSSSADWRATHILRGGYYCHRPREFNEGIQEKILANGPAIGRGEAEAVKLVLEALLLSGFGMVIAGSSAPASGGEHLISHFIDMKDALHHGGHDLHGIQVGVATVYTLGLWEQILSLDTTKLDAKALAAAHPSDAEIKEWVFEEWGDTVGQEVWEQWQQKTLSREALEAEIEHIKEKLPLLRSVLTHDLLPPGIVARCIEECGGPTLPEGLHVPQEEYAKALKHARYLRNRFTVLDMAAELGVV